MEAQSRLSDSSLCDNSLSCTFLATAGTRCTRCRLLLAWSPLARATLSCYWRLSWHRLKIELLYPVWMIAIHFSSATIDRNHEAFLPNDVKHARSMPRSSVFSISRKLPTVFVIGFMVNEQCSLLDGRGTVILGSPRWYATVTSESALTCIRVFKRDAYDRGFSIKGHFRDSSQTNERSILYAIETERLTFRQRKRGANTVIMKARIKHRRYVLGLFALRRVRKVTFARWKSPMRMFPKTTRYRTTRYVEIKSISDLRSIDLLRPAPTAAVD